MVRSLIKYPTKYLICFLTKLNLIRNNKIVWIEFCKLHLPSLLQLSRSGVKLRYEAGTVANGDGVGIATVGAEAADKAGRTDADF